MRPIFAAAVAILLINCSIPADTSNNYSDNAVLVLADGEIIMGAEKINEYYKSLGIITGGRETIFTTRANNTFDYSISSLQSGDRAYRFITVARSTEEKLRVFEVVAEVTGSSDDRKLIDMRREEWVKLCNQHDSGVLVRQLYAENPIYYNHKPLVTSPEALTREYSYMNNPNYSLRLDPLHLEIVATDLAFEIGQCSGSYNGKYVIVWKKDGSGQWRVKVDSNI